MSTFTCISLADAKTKIDSGTAIVVDIRDPGSYAEAHIPGALPLDGDTIEAFLKDTDRSQPILVCCYHGNSSKSAADYLCQQGFKEVYSMDGGFEGWRGVNGEDQ